MPGLTQVFYLNAFYEKHLKKRNLKRKQCGTKNLNQAYIQIAKRETFNPSFAVCKNKKSRQVYGT